MHYRILGDPAVSVPLDYKSRSYSSLNRWTYHWPNKTNTNTELFTVWKMTLNNFGKVVGKHLKIKRTIEAMPTLRILPSWLMRVSLACHTAFPNMFKCNVLHTNSCFYWLTIVLFSTSELHHKDARTLHPEQDLWISFPNKPNWVGLF